MKNLIFLMILTATTQAGAECVNISGKYSSPANTTDYKTTYIITQNQCDWIEVTSLVVQKSVSTTSATYPLNGTPAKLCLIDAFNNCGSMTIAPAGIRKRDPQNSATADPIHGYCEFRTSVLSLDYKNNLVEAFEGVECEDGYRGYIAQRVYPRMN